MNELQIFENPKFGHVRTITENGKTLFCGKDVATALGYKRPADAITAHCKGSVIRRLPTSGGEQDAKFIPEGDIYRLAARSELPGADEFERWIFDEVLPSIRKHGAYIAGQEIMSPEELLARAVLAANSMIEEMKERLHNEQALRKEADQNVHMLSIVNRQQKPMVDYFMACVDRNNLTSLRETAKLLHVKEKKLITFLLDNKYLYRSPSGKLLPHGGRSENMFEVKEAVDQKRGWFGVQTFVNPRGRETLRLLLNGQPESGLWGEPYVSPALPASKVPDMTEGEAYRLEEYYKKQARAHKE